MIPSNRYPSGLVPYIGLVGKITIPDQKNPENGFDVARRVKRSKLEMIDLEDGYLIIPASLRSTVFDRKEIPDMSMNILSRDSYPDWVNYNQLDDAHAKWNKKTVIPHRFVKKLKREDTIAVVFKASEFHKKPYPYYKTISDKQAFERLEPYMDKEDEKTKELLSKQFQKGNQYKVEGWLELEHKPAMMNYWHVTLVIREDGSGKIVTKPQNAAQKELCDFVINHILALKGVINKQDFKWMHPIYYIDTAVHPALAGICRWFRNWLTSSIELHNSND